MIDRIITSSVQRRFVVLIVALVIIGYGVDSLFRLNVAAFPDVTNIQVQINTVAPGLAAEEVEKLVTFPVESVMSGLPDVTELRSVSKTGLSVVTVVFADNVDIYFARQLVLERLQVARERIPPEAGDPEMGPISTGLGQVYMYKLESDGHSLMELRSINDWFVKFQLRTVPGVADVLSFGGEVRQYQVNVSPFDLAGYDLTLADVREAIEKNNTNAGGWYLEGVQQQLVVRGVGMVRGGDNGLSDLQRIVLKSQDGRPVFISDVANVTYGSEIRQGAVTMNGTGEVVLGIVLQLKGANTIQVIDAVRERVANLQRSLPRGVKIVPVYDQAELVNKAVSTVTEALQQAAVLIIAVLFLFLWNVRAATIVALSIPISMLVALIMMRWFGLSANLQSLGGLAIGIGMMVDGAVVMVENIVRHLAKEDAHHQPLAQRVCRAALEVGHPVFFAVLIIIVVFLPLFTLRGVEGKLFAPMAFTIAFAMLGSLVVSLTLVPALSSLALRGRGGEADNVIVRGLKALYRPIVRWAIAHRFIVGAVAAVALIACLATVPFLGTEFVPELEEGTMVIRVTMNPSISLPEAKRIAGRLETKLLQYPEVTYVFSPIGRAELGGEPEAISNNEMMVGLKPQEEWTTAHSREALVERIRDDLSDQPGVLFNFTQPIATRVDELLSGVKAQIAIKLFGEDLTVLETKGNDIAGVIEELRGASDVQMEQISGEAQLVVRADREALARYGLNTADVMDVVSTAVGGETVGEVIDGQKRFAIYLRMAEAYRADPKAIGELWIANEEGVRVPLSDVAHIETVMGPPTISREDAQRRVVVQCNVQGRDMGGFVLEAQRAVRECVTLPAGYFVTWGGQFENQQRAQRTLMIVVPLSLVLIFVLLCMSFRSVRNALLILLNVPFALIGGVFCLALTGQYLSVPSSVGFIALFGVAVLNGVVMVTCFNQLRDEGMDTHTAVVEGALLRLRPVLMTAMVASLGLIPLLLSTGIGAEVQRPLATVVVGGLLSSTCLTLLVLPSFYEWFAARKRLDQQREEN